MSVYHTKASVNLLLWLTDQSDWDIEQIVDCLNNIRCFVDTMRCMCDHSHTCKTHGMDDYIMHILTVVENSVDVKNQILYIIGEVKNFLPK